MGQPESSSLREDNLCNRHTERNLKITSCVREVWDQGYLCWDMLISPVHKNGLAGVPQFFNFLQNYNFRFTDISLKGNLLSIMSRSFPDQKSQIKNYHWSWKSFVKEWKNCLLFTNQAKKWKQFLKKNYWVSKLYVNFARIFIVLINSLPAPLLYSDINIQDLPNSLKIEFPSKRCGSEKYVTLFTEFLAE